MEQLVIERPFGVECLRVAIDFDPGNGWRWRVSEWLAGHSKIVNRGVASSSRKALQAVLEVLSDLDDDLLYG